MKVAERTLVADAQFRALPGVSVIVATYQGGGRIGSLLESLALQTLEYSRFEVVIISNGDVDNTEQVVEDFSHRHPAMLIRFFRRRQASAGGARNLGIDVARMSRTTFADDDDVLEPNYLRAALKLSTGRNIVVSPIVNVEVNGELDYASSLSTRIGSLQGLVKVAEHPWLLGFNACKLAPTWMMRTMRYSEDLTSGEDLVFWAQLSMRKDLEAAVVRDLDGAAYRRYVRPDTVSRRAVTWDFSVLDRLKCIGELENITLPEEGPGRACVRALASAQAGHVRRYIDENPEERPRVVEAINSSGIRHFPWRTINKGRAKSLAFLYCFAPFNDPSAVVAAKALAERREIVDVISNDMSAVRDRDPAVSVLAEEWLEDQILLKTPPSFAGWGAISDFAEKAVKKADQMARIKGKYETLYTRSLWVGSHVAGALYKLNNWDIRWTAEFSDPLRRDAQGDPRAGLLTDNSVARLLQDAMESRGFGSHMGGSLFDLVELATFVLADELLFTNSNQLNYMLSLVESEELREATRKKSRIRQHPTPPPRAYSVSPSQYAVPDGVVNIGYFGSFYPNRGIGDVLVALSNSTTRVRQDVRLHVFSTVPDEVVAQANELGVADLVYSNKYLSYLEFLNATTEFDVLLVSDVARGSLLPVNPFLPSKLSDYRGSGSKIWALVDRGSPMDGMEFDYVTPLGNGSAMIATIQKIAQSA